MYRRLMKASGTTSPPSTNPSAPNARATSTMTAAGVSAFAPSAIPPESPSTRRLPEEIGFDTHGVARSCMPGAFQAKRGKAETSMKAISTDAAV